MKLNFIKSGLALAAILSVAIGLSATAHATNIGTIASGGSFSDTISSNGPTFGRDYNFQLVGAATEVSLLATAFGRSDDGFGISSMTIKLFDSANNLITSASGAPITFFDTFANTGIGLGAGNYLFTIFGDVIPGKKAFVSVSLATNGVATTPIPAAGLMLLTGLGALGGVAWRRRRASGYSSTGLAA